MNRFLAWILCLMSFLLVLPASDPAALSGTPESLQLGYTPMKLEEDLDELLISGTGWTYCRIETDTLFEFDLENGTLVNAGLSCLDGFFLLTAASGDLSWYQSYLETAVNGLTVGTRYNFMVDTRGIEIDEEQFETQGHWILLDGNEKELAVRDNLHGTNLYFYTFTATTEQIKLRWYPATNSTFQSGYSVGQARAFYINKDNTTDHTRIMVLNRPFWKERSFLSVPRGAEISTTPVCKLSMIPHEEDEELPLKGRTVVCFGDSLFGMERGDTSAPAYIAGITGATVYNVGFGGCRMSVHPSDGYAQFSMWALAKAVAEKDWTEQDRYAESGSDYFREQLELLKTLDFETVDYVVIHYGTNDFGGGVEIGENSPSWDYSTLCGALRYSITALRTAYPNLTIFVSLPAFRFWDVDGVRIYSDTYRNNQNVTLQQAVEALQRVAQEMDVEVIDNYYGLGIDRSNADSLLSDGTHLNAAGRKLLGEYIGTKLMNYEESNRDR